MSRKQKLSDNEPISNPYSDHEIGNILHVISGETDYLEHENNLQQQKIETLLETLGKHKITDIETLSSLKEVLCSLKKSNQSIKTTGFCAKQGKYLFDNKLKLDRLESKKLTANPVPFDPQVVIKQVIDMFSIAAQKKQIVLSSQIDRVGPTLQVKGDRILLIQILSNLLNNAIKFTDHGSIEITLREEFKKESDSSILYFAIKDSGIGMTEQEQEKLFQLFSQASPQTSGMYGGSGLGLKITKLLVELMGGSIQVTSQKGQGTVFTFSIACQPYFIKEQPLNLDQKSLSLEMLSVRLDNIRILIVDDNDVSRGLLERQMKMAGGICFTVSSGMKAIDFVAQNKDKVDIILMDVQMPGMNGLIATQEIRKQEKSSGLTPIPVIGISADKEAEDEALKRGMNSYFIKPYDKEELLKGISNLVKVDSQKSPLSSIAIPPLSPFSLSDEKKLDGNLTTPRPRRLSPPRSLSSDDRYDMLNAAYSATNNCRMWLKKNQHQQTSSSLVTVTHLL